MRTMYLTYDLVYPFKVAISVTDNVINKDRAIKLFVPEHRVDFVTNPQNFYDKFYWFEYVIEHFSAWE